MKKTAFERLVLSLLVVASILLIVLLLPGLNFEFGHDRYGGISRISREHTQKGAIALVG